MRLFIGVPDLKSLYVLSNQGVRFGLTTSTVTRTDQVALVCSR
jgi:hypothetical protein